MGVDLNLNLENYTGQLSFYIFKCSADLGVHFVLLVLLILSRYEDKVEPSRPK